MSTITAAAAPRGLRWLWQRELPHYPDTARRMSYLGITILATIALYYALFVQGAVAPQIIAEYHFSFTEFVVIVAIGATFGAFASLAAGLADRWGRANLVVIGLLLTSLLITFAMPNASSKAEYAVYYALLSIVEGIILVATPALIRDFSPQVGRAAAMAFWTLGPVLGSLVVTEVSSNTLPSHPDWRYQFQLCGVVGLVVFVITLIGLRELSPRLRDQLMVSLRDRALIEARAAGIDPESALKGHWRQMLRVNIIGSAFAIGLFLVLFYIFTAFAVVFLGTVFGYPASRANAVANWYWITAAIMMLVIGFASDRVLVRKPFMVVGAVISLAGTALLAVATTNPQTGYYTFALSFVLMAAGLGLAYPTWMAGFTETVEKQNPAATATGLALWGWILRLVAVASFLLLPVVVPATSTLVDNGARVSAIAVTYPEQIEVLQTVDPATLAALKADPASQPATAKAVGEIAARFGIPPAQAAERLASLSAVPPADLAYLSANAPTVAQAAKDNPGQWQTWWWICFVSQLVFIPFVFLMAGHWNPRKARAEEQEHERMVQRELALLEAARADRETQARGAEQ
jgi:MFS family permease